MKKLASLFRYRISFGVRMLTFNEGGRGLTAHIILTPGNHAEMLPGRISLRLYVLGVATTLTLVNSRPLGAR